MKGSRAVGCLPAASIFVALGCSGPHIVLPEGADEEALSFDCPDTGTAPPRTLECTGLYADFGKKRLASSVQPYAPALPLWSDALDKERWIFLPKGEQIDTSDPSQWSFPVGTKFWKEFSDDGRRIETRLFHKVRNDKWNRTTYLWSEDESEATQFLGGEVEFDGKSYHLPDGTECDECHKGSADRILGFEAVSLSLPEAEGLTTEKLVEKDLLSDPPNPIELQIPDDGTEAAVDALRWLHVNCGASCHNGHPNATGYPSGLRLRLDPDDLDDEAPEEWDPLRTTIGVGAQIVGIMSNVRIIPGRPEESLVTRLIRLPPGAEGRMPPIATRVIDEEGVRSVEEWIRRMGDGSGEP